MENDSNRGRIVFMRILFLNSSLTSGGSERVMTLLANKFADKGIDTTMSLVRELGPDTYKVNDKVDLIRYKYGTKNKAIIAIKRFKKIRKQIKKGCFDAVIVFMNDLNLITLIAAGNLGTPIYISERADPSKRNVGKLYKLLEKHYYPKCAGIVFQTSDVAAQFPDELRKKSTVIPNPVSENLPEPYTEKRKKKIVSAGRLTDQKNFPMLINTFARFHREYPEYELFIYGKGPKEAELKELVKSKGIESSVHFPGFVDNIINEIMDAEIYVSTSNFEGISNSMIEAMAMGLAVICTDCPVGGARMMIENGVNGILIPVEDEELLHNELAEVANDNYRADKLGNNAIRIREQFSADRVSDIWIEMVSKR